MQTNLTTFALSKNSARGKSKTNEFIFSIHLLLLSVQPCQSFAVSGFSDPQIEN